MGTKLCQQQTLYAKPSPDIRSGFGPLFWLLSSYLPVSLVAENKADLAGAQHFGVQAESLIGDDENRVGRPPTVGVHEPTCTHNIYIESYSLSYLL